MSSGSKVKHPETIWRSLKCVNCEQNSILYRVIPKGKGACHTKDKNGRARTGCYYRTLTNKGTLEFREEIE